MSAVSHRFKLDGRRQAMANVHSALKRTPISINRLFLAPATPSSHPYPPPCSSQCIPRDPRLAYGFEHWAPGSLALPLLLSRRQRGTTPAHPFPTFEMIYFTIYSPWCQRESLQQVTFLLRIAPQRRIGCHVALFPADLQGILWIPDYYSWSPAGKTLSTAGSPSIKSCSTE